MHPVGVAGFDLRCAAGAVIGGASETRNCAALLSCSFSKSRQKTIDIKQAYECRSTMSSPASTVGACIIYRAAHDHFVIEVAWARLAAGAAALYGGYYPIID
jgi:hypothetical protein